MFRIAIAACALAGWTLAWPADFRFDIGSPVAAGDFAFKTAAFVFRTEGCTDPAKAQINATAEGLVKGARRSVPLKVATIARPGVYAVFQTWGPDGAWVVNLKGACGDANAGAVVPFGPKGFIRESAKFFPRSATDAEIEESLKALAQGAAK